MRLKLAVLFSMVLLVARCGNDEKSAVAAPVRSEPVPVGAPQPPTSFPDNSFSVVPVPGQPVNVGISPSLAIAPGPVPMVAFIVRDPNSDGDETDSGIVFVRWDSAGRKWGMPVEVDTLGKVLDSPQLQVTRDVSDGLLAIAYRRSATEIWLATSRDDGATWKKEKLFPASSVPTEAIDSPAVAAAGGALIVAWTAGERLTVAERLGRDEPFNFHEAPTLTGCSGAKQSRPSVAFDSSGRGAVAWLLNPSEGATVSIGFWRPDETAAAKVADSNGVQNDTASLSLAFSGTRPRLAFNLSRAGAETGEGGPMYIVSSDDGTVWTAPSHVPQDGGNAMDGTLELAVDARGNAAIVAPMTGGNSEGARCGQPKLARSSDLQNWITCSPDRNGSMHFDADAASTAFDADGKLWIAIHNATTSARLPPGLLVWRGP